MEETIQDLVWACLPQEARLEIKRSYNYQCRNKEYNRGFNKALENIFGDHNLTSDEEPPELLFVERKKVQEIYRHFSVGHDPTDKDNKFNRKLIEAKRMLLIHLLGDKYLSDKEPSVQVEPRFKVGELIMSEGKVGRVLEYDSVREFPYLIHFPFNNSKVYRLESDLEPYTEPETKDAYEQYQESKAEEYNNQLKDNMEEKELNRKALYDALCELESASVKVRKALISM